VGFVESDFQQNADSGFLTAGRAREQNSKNAGDAMKRHLGKILFCEYFFPKSHFFIQL